MQKKRKNKNKASLEIHRNQKQEIKEEHIYDNTTLTYNFLQM